MERHLGPFFLLKKNCQVIHISWLNFSKVFLLFGIKELGSSFVPFKVGDKWGFEFL